MRSIKVALILAGYLFAFSAGATPVNLRNVNTTLSNDVDFVTTLDTLTAARTVTLPAAANFNGSMIQFYDTLPAINGANTYTFIAQGTDLINGAVALVLSSPGSSTTFVRSPTGWYASQSAGVAPFKINPPASSLVQGLNVTQTVSGTPDSSTFGYPNYWANSIFVNTDDAVVSGSNFGSALTIFHNYGGSNMTGGRNSLSVYSVLINPPSGSTANRNYVGALFNMHAKANAGGTDPTTNPKGGAFGFNPQVILENGATAWLEASAGEVNIAVQSGASVYYKNTLSLVNLASDAVHGSAYDMSLAISAQAGSIGVLNGIFFGDMNGAFPVASTGALMNGSHGSIDRGIDLSNITFADSAFKSNGFIVRPNGTIIVSGQVQLSGGALVNWQTRSVMQSPDDGVLLMTNNAQTDFSQLQFGGVTGSFPSIKRSGTGLVARLADDTANTFFVASRVQVTDIRTSSTLVTCNGAAEGLWSAISDATAPTYNGNIVGGGAVHTPVYCNGTTWTTH